MVSTKSPAGEQRTLHTLSWQRFKTILAEMGDRRSSRIAYSEGQLEIMTPLMRHERDNRQIERLILILAEELNLNLLSVGSLTCQRDDLQRACEPDSSYYIANEPLVRAKDAIDLNIDPPPDLVLEVEYTSSDLNKLDLYASLGVPEFWRYKDGVLHIYCLQAGQYVECETSPTFAPIAVREIPRFLNDSRQIGEIATLKVFRQWIGERLRK